MEKTKERKSRNSGIGMTLLLVAGCSLLNLVFNVPAFTAEGTKKGSDKKGKYWFKKSCKGCHGKKGDGGEVTPISKTIKQWERYFKKGIHQEEEPLEGTFDAEQLIHIRHFLINHAADSDQPETCG